MKYLVILFLVIAAVALMYLKKAYRTQIALGFLGLLALLSLILSVRSLPSTVPLTRTFNQLFYQENVQDENYFDAILPLMVGGKTIYTKDDINHLTFDMSDPSNTWEVRLKAIYHRVKYQNILQAMEEKVVQDNALNDAEIKR